MTRKDYELIAFSIRVEIERMNIMPPGGPWDSEALSTGLATIELVARGLADALAVDNPRFERERFLRACGIN